MSHSVPRTGSDSGTGSLLDGLFLAQPQSREPSACGETARLPANVFRASVAASWTPVTRRGSCGLCAVRTPFPRGDRQSLTQWELTWPIGVPSLSASVGPRRPASSGNSPRKRPPEPGPAGRQRARTCPVGGGGEACGALWAAGIERELVKPLPEEVTLLRSKAFPGVAVHFFQCFCHCLKHFCSHHVSVCSCISKKKSRNLVEHKNCARAMQKNSKHGQ